MLYIAGACVGVLLLLIICCIVVCICNSKCCRKDEFIYEEDPSTGSFRRRSTRRRSTRRRKGSLSQSGESKGRSMRLESFKDALGISMNYNKKSTKKLTGGMH